MEPITLCGGFPWEGNPPYSLKGGVPSFCGTYYIVRWVPLGGEPTLLPGIKIETHLPVLQGQFQLLNCDSSLNLVHCQPQI